MYAAVIIAVVVIAYRIHMKHHNHHEEHDTSRDISGELVVTGRGDIDIEERLPNSRMLEARPEEVVCVRFDDEEPPHPSCNTHHHDHLSWELRLRKCCEFHRHDSDHRMYEYYVLHIQWHVFDTRTIIWSVRGA